MSRDKRKIHVKTHSPERPEQVAPQADEMTARDDAQQPGTDQPRDPQAQPDDSPPTVDDSLADLDQLRGQLDEAQDRVLRTQAELENYRRRVAREMEQERRYAAMPLLRDLLPVLDNVNRAIEAAEQSDGGGGLLEGFRMVASQLEDVLRRHDCVRIEALDQPFDPNFHEAITQQPSGDVPPNTVIHVAQTGYQLHDRVVRPSQVIVSTAAD
jgi:molecular chaperone GrpE